ncbi:potassium channel family protein, partial [Mycoplasma buteonis]|uniref:potassium channel family protein n=1 Tax=Mycoplasma buteonis TaxID=171280 RepID=UPI00055C28B6
MNWKFWKKASFNKEKFWKSLAIVVWSKNEEAETLDNNKLVILFRTIYAVVVAICCLISFSSLFRITSEQIQTAIKFVQLFTLIIFIADYVLHALTYQYIKNITNKNSFITYLKYVFSWNSIVIICCILASIHIIGYFGTTTDEFKKTVEYFKTFNIIRIVRLFMVLTIFAPFSAITKVFSSQKKVLSSVFLLIVILIILFAFVIWNNEQGYLKQIETDYAWEWAKQNSSLEMFTKYQNYLESTNNPDVTSDTYKKIIEITIPYLEHHDSQFTALSNGYVTDFWTAIYFTTITLTTIGYGDFVPHAPITRIIVVFISLLAIAIIAIPSGIIASAFLTEVQQKKANEKNQKRQKLVDKIKVKKEIKTNNKGE